MPTKSINEIIRQETNSNMEQDIQKVNQEKQISDLSSEELDEIFSLDDTEFIDNEDDWLEDEFIH